MNPPSSSVRTPAAPSVAVDRLVVRARGDASAGARLAERLPGALEQALAGAGAHDERSVRGLIDHAVRSAAR